MKSFETSASIRASADTVWALLTNGPSYPSWDTGVERVEGTIAPGETIKVFSKVSPGRAFPVRVSEFTPGHKMVWSGGMPLGLFKGVRTFTLAPQGDGSTRFAMREEFSGPLLPMIWKSMPDLEPVFQQFAADLKQQAERTT
jgi:hypothetical protein